MKNRKISIDKLIKFLPENFIPVIQKISVLTNQRVYLVGGIVRDFLLGRECLDLDIAVEGDALEFVRCWAEEFQCKYHDCSRFSGGKISDPHFGKIDFTGLRKETYSEYGALPIVERATLKEDARRRDFTINSIYIELSADQLGVLHDYFDGLKDLEHKKIRVLHQESFFEDPVRILRAVRFASRLNYTLDLETYKQIESAINAKMILRANQKRLFDEILNGFREENEVAWLKQVETLNILNKMSFQFQGREKYSLLRRKIHKAISWITPEKLFIRPELIKLIYHISWENPDCLSKFMEWGIFHTQEKKFMSFLSDFAASLKKWELDIPETHFIHETLEKQFPCSGIWAWIHCRNRQLRKKILAYLLRNIRLKPIIDGYSLRKLGFVPGPLLGEILKKLRILQLEKIITNKSEAFKWISENY